MQNRVGEREIIVLTALQEAETLGVRNAERNRVTILEMKCLIGVTRIDRIRIEELSRKAKIESLQDE